MGANDDIKIVIIEDSDSKLFYVKKNIKDFSITIHDLLEDFKDNSEIFQIDKNVKIKCFEWILEYIEKYKNDKSEMEYYTNPDKKSEKLTKWDKEFFEKMDMNIKHLLIAADYLNIPGLMEKATLYSANYIIKKKSNKEIRELFDLPDDITQEEENKIKHDFEWLEDKEKLKKK